MTWQPPQLAQQNPDVPMPVKHALTLGAGILIGLGVATLFKKTEPAPSKPSGGPASFPQPPAQPSSAGSPEEEGWFVIDWYSNLPGSGVGYPDQGASVPFWTRRLFAESFFQGSMGQCNRLWTWSGTEWVMIASRCRSGV
jgi:hypothetical protein